MTKSRKGMIFADYPDVVNVEQMCSMLGGIGETTAYDLLRNGDIRHIKLGKSIDFESNTITIDHTVVQFRAGGETKIVSKERTKNKSSCRSMPLVPQYRELLLLMKEHQESCRELCGNCYTQTDYIYVNDLAGSRAITAQTASSFCWATAALDAVRAARNTSSSGLKSATAFSKSRKSRLSISNASTAKCPSGYRFPFSRHSPGPKTAEKESK